MGLFSKKSFQYVAGVTPQGKPVMSTVKIGNRKGQCASGEGYCQEHRTLQQWEHYSRWAGVMPTEDELADQLGWIFKDPSKMKVSQPISMNEYVQYERENNPGFVLEDPNEE